MHQVIEPINLTGGYYFDGRDSPKKYQEKPREGKHRGFLFRRPFCCCCWSWTGTFVHERTSRYPFPRTHESDYFPSWEYSKALTSGHQDTDSGYVDSSPWQE